MHDPVKRREELKTLFDSSPIRKTLEMELSYTHEGQAVFDMPHQPSLEHGLGDTHGGVIATLLDNAGWFTVAANYQSWVATVEMQMRLLEPARREKLRAIGRLIRAGKHLAVAEMEVTTTSGRKVATGSGTFAITSLVLNVESDES